MGQPGERTSPRYFLVLSLGALGVVYGDIGTSPLYALRECFHQHHGVPPTPENIFGILSLIFWSLTIVISFKYLVFVMRADNRGEGGILALMSLVRARGSGSSQARLFLVALGLFGAALLYGDGMITPAISVLSAVEGIDVATPVFRPYIVPATIVVIIVLFVLQRAGTARVGAMFGPVMLVWFAVIAILGVMQIVQEPHVLGAVNPAHAFTFFAHNRMRGFLVLGAVFLCVTGGEALYADMGHFGARPIRLAWFVLVFPCLLLNYFGQGALLLHDPKAAEHPFFHMAPNWAQLPLVGLATLATIIASQAVISGAFSLTRQAVQLGYAPRLNIRHTSAREIGQIYIASVNWALMFCAIGLVLAFRSSSALAAAYGVAVTTTMGITTALLAVVERERWKWSIPAMIALTVPLLIIDLSFFGANIIKVTEGGWFPLVVGIFVFTLLATWRRGREILGQRLAEGVIPIETLVKEVARGALPRVRGTAIFLSRYSDGVPITLLHNIKHNKVFHEHVVLLTVSYEETSHLGDMERHEWTDVGSGIYRLHLRFGFMEEPNIPALLASMRNTPFPIDLAAVSFFLGRETLIASHRPGMALWREKLFSWMIRNASSASHWFQLPTNQVIELGAQIEL
jgi:KUP system potassium uptake protein